MQFLIDGVLRDFVELKSYRLRHDLPASFGTAHFEPKNYEGLGSIEKAGAALAQFKARVLAGLPTLAHPGDWLPLLPSLTQRFHEELEAINAQVGLRDVEIEFAAAGYGDALSAWVYALIYAHAAQQPPPDFRQVYADWLNSTVRLSQTLHPYPHQGESWQVQLITHVYGRMGLRVARPQAVDYVYDARLACPAEGFMLNLLTEVAARIPG